MDVKQPREISMTVWVDADSCPVAVKEILFKAAKRAEMETILVANHYMQVPPSPWIQLLQVESGFDKADDYIVEKVLPGDLVVTGDIPLASEIIAKQALVINSRGEALDKQNIGARLNMRDFMETMRSSGEQTGGPKAFSQRDKQNFANALDRYIAKSKR